MMRIQGIARASFLRCVNGLVPIIGAIYLGRTRANPESTDFAPLELSSPGRFFLEHLPIAANDHI